ncbi:chromosomal replication initiator protein DnaA [Candidatus Peregrinibacteria bacterium]|jgi:chromosomal replication initiator protein|nr:chromosomal replication initiator protein DnaA [Candidatus Peregrinibacteria bacterium]MBT4055718.1 chromosomal replication initiator protein DnaA [Candidatus Peregrinibacteria bacterium]
MADSSLSSGSLKDLWVEVLTRIEPTITRAHFVTWFQSTTLADLKGDVLTVGVPTVFALNWIESKYAVKILQAAQEKREGIASIEFKVVNKLADGNEGIDVGTINSRPEKTVRKVRNKAEVHLGNGVVSKMLNPRYNLQNFVVGRDNRLPHAASQAVSNMPGGIYNPLYIYGGVGLGKTHLLQSVGNEILKMMPEKTVRYVTAEKFVSEVVRSIADRSMAKFKDLYRNVDVLLLDDVQFFAKKDSSQQEFFHTFNELYDANKQIVLTSDRPPSELDNLDKRLTSRFGMGMVTEILMPDFETRVAILQSKCMEQEVLIDNEVLEFIAANVETSVRELEGVLRQVVAEAELEERVPTVNSAAGVFKKLFKAKEIIGYEVERKKLDGVVTTSTDVMHVVANYYRVSMDDLVGEKRTREVLVPRQICMYLIRYELEESLEKIGGDLGGRNHTTVINACTKIIKKLKSDQKLIRDINAIKREMGL